MANTKKLGCDYCKQQGGEPGWIETDNNGPIVACPVCNPTGEIDRAWEMAEAQLKSRGRA